MNASFRARAGMRRLLTCLGAAMFAPLLLAAFAVPGPARAQVATPPICSPAGYTVVFINGVNNSPEEAGVNMRALQHLVNETTHNGQPLDFFLTYNPTRGLGGDLVDAAVLKSVQLGVPFSAVFQLYLLGNVVDPIIAALDQLTQANLRSGVVAYYAQVLNAAAARDLSSDPDFGNIVASVSGLAPNRALLLVGHSQGTLYTNAVYQRMLSNGRAASSMAVTGAAVVADQLAGSYKTYVTSTSDAVVNAARLAGAVAPATHTGPVPSAPPPFPPEDPIWLHSFSGIYANPAYGLSVPLRDAVLAGLDSLTIPTAIGGSLACKLVINVNGSRTGWTIPPVVEMSGLIRANRATFSLAGTTGNTCGTGERGSPLYSLDVAIPSDVDFFHAPTVTGVPYQNSPGSPNRRPCSAFVARTMVPPPANGVLAARERIWANATGRIQTFGGTNLDWEYQLRFDSGDPWTGTSKRCDIGLVPGSGVFQSSLQATCTAQLIAL